MKTCLMRCEVRCVSSEPAHTTNAAITDMYSKNTHINHENLMKHWA